MKRLGLVFVMVLALAATVGCSKKTTSNEVPPMETSAWSQEEQQAMQMITNARIFFEFNKFDINVEGKEILRNKAELLKQYPRIRVRIEGNCDARGTQEYNLALGERRARAAYEYLTMMGVNPSQLEMLSFGKENPAVMGTGEAVWAQNRRDDFIVVNQ